MNRQINSLPAIFQSAQRPQLTGKWVFFSKTAVLFPGWLLLYPSGTLHQFPHNFYFLHLPLGLILFHMKPVGMLPVVTWLARPGRTRVQIFRWRLFGSGERSHYVSYLLHSLHSRGNSAYAGWATFFLIVKEVVLLWGHSTIFQLGRDFCQSKPTTLTNRTFCWQTPVSSSSNRKLSSAGSCTTRQPGYHHLVLQLQPDMAFIL